MHKQATTIYAEKKAKPHGKSAGEVSNQIKEVFGVQLSSQKIQRYVKNEDIGTSHRKLGNPGTILSFVFQTLCIAMETFMKINQVNGKNMENSRKKLHNCVLKVMGKEKVVRMNLLDQILKETAFDILSKHITYVEDRRVK